MATREDDARRRRINVDLPSQNVTPLRKILRRLAVAVGLILFVALVTYIGRDGYYDPEGDGVSLLDSFYYSTVTITTTGYGDIRPVTDEARLMTTILVTPARVLFLIILVGTTLEVLAEHSRRAFRQERWRRRLRLTHDRLRLRHEGQGCDSHPVRQRRARRPDRRDRDQR